MAARDEIAALKKLCPAAAAWLVGLSTPTAMTQRLDMPRNDDGTYSGQSLVKAWVEWSVAKASRRGGVAAEDGDALELKRRLEAQKLELQLLEMQKRVVPLHQTTEMFGHFQSRMRQFGETLQRAYGPDALGLLNETLTDLKSSYNRWHDNLTTEDDLLSG